MDPKKENSQRCPQSAQGRSFSMCKCTALQTKKSRRGRLTIFLSAISFAYFAKALTGSYLKSSITQIERRFELPSSLVGVMDGSFEIGNLLVITLVSYFGAGRHRARLIGGGCLLMAAGTFLIALPHFIMARYTYDSAPTRTANASTSFIPCLQDGTGHKYAAEEPGCQRNFENSLWIFILFGNLLRGVGEAPIQPLGISYIDDYASEDNAAFYIGCIQTAAVIGPIFGFLLGSLCASLFVDLGAVDLDFLPSMKRLLGNPVFFLYLCGSVFQYNSLVGMVTYKPKYIEQQYGQTSSRTNFIIGLINVPAVALGIFLGGVVMKKSRIGVVGAAKLLLSSSVMGYVILLSLFGMGCERPSVAGLTVSYAGYTHIAQADGALAECNEHCLCPHYQWDPVCGDNGVTYYSACFAGCRFTNGTGTAAVYANCSCVAHPPLLSGGSSAVPGPCSRGSTCSRMFLYFVVVSVITSFTLSLGGTPGYILLLRCVHPELKSLALGIYTMTVRVLAGVPAPMYYGALIDSVCLKWGVRQCSRKGSCRLYNTDAFRSIYLGMTLALGAVFLGLSAAVLYILKKRCLTGENCAPCNSCKSSALPSGLLRCGCWSQKETRL